MTSDADMVETALGDVDMRTGERIMYNYPVAVLDYDTKRFLGHIRPPLRAIVRRDSAGSVGFPHGVVLLDDDGQGVWLTQVNSWTVKLCDAAQDLGYMRLPRQTRMERMAGPKVGAVMLVDTWNYRRLFNLSNFTARPAGSLDPTRRMRRWLEL